MRLIVLDTETTGLSPLNGDRMVEIGAIEIHQRQISKQRVFHKYINPGRPIPKEVVRIHGIDDKKVAGEKTFAGIADDFLEFIDGATLVIHNAPFDLGFIMNELQECGKKSISRTPVIDTLSFARQRHPHQRNNLDALCDRYNIARDHRELHGALLDSELLAEVYLAMTGGRQFSLGMDIPSQPAANIVQLPERSRKRDEQTETARIMQRRALPIQEEEHAAHLMLMQRIHSESGGKSIWHHPETS